LNLLDLFRPKWRHGDKKKRLEAVLKIARPKTLRKIVDESDDEHLRFEAARRLNDRQRIRKMAASASIETVRLEASILIGEQSFLASIALKAWNIQLGRRAIDHIENELLLRRVARSAKQDAIRLAAALKLGDDDLLRRVASSSNHIDVHWQVAKSLDDPVLLAEIILFKPSNMRLEPLRRQARRALIDHLNRCKAVGNDAGLLNALRTVPHPIFKMESFLRLDPVHVTYGALKYLAAQDIRYLPKKMVDHMIRLIESAGWQVTRYRQESPCDYCQSKGRLSLKYLSANDTWADQDYFPCPDCHGKGAIPVSLIRCTRKDRSLQIQLPA
jgi:hypothetical protein